MNTPKHQSPAAPNTPPVQHPPQTAVPAAGQSAAAKSEAQAKGEQQIRELNGRFTTSLPDNARTTGNYEAEEGGLFADEKIDLPNGVYRVTGSDWVIRVAKHHFAGASRAVPPNFGGEKEGGTDVVQVPNG